MRYVRWLPLCAALVGSGPALAVGRLADVTVVDRDTGVALTPHYFHGEYWVAGTPGARYAIEIHSHAGGRLLAVTSVDGVNVISGQTAGWDQTGYVFSPWQDYQITGWRKSDEQIAAFTFTALPNSYAALTGRPANVGVIGVALFSERTPLPPVVEEAPVAAAGAVPPSRAEASSPAEPAAPGAGRAAPRDSASAKALADSTLKREQRLGTGHGEREYSYVSRTDFDRLSSEPNEVIRIRYDSLQNLMAMGIVRRPRPAPVGADPFPASDRQYVADPPG
jgi:hypothetical protein